MAHFSPEDAPALAFAADIGEQLALIFRQSSVQIVAVNDDAFREHGSITVVTGDRIVTQMGTGTLFCIGERHFLVSAGHVFDEIEKRGESPSIWYGDPPAPLPLVGSLYTSSAPTDLAALQLDEKIVAGLADRRFLTLADVDLRPDLGNGWYFLHGYPFTNAHTSKDLLTTLQTDFTYRTGLYGGSTSGFRSYDPGLHILVGYDGETRLADDGSLADFPKSLGGISGSSVWLGFSERHFMDDWNPDLAKVVAVETLVYPVKRVAQATRWTGVAMLLWKNVPKLRDEIRSHLPDELKDHFESA